MWGEWIPTVEKMNRQVYPRIAAYAEAFWSAPSQKDFSRFQRSLLPFLTAADGQGENPVHYV